ncbi:Progestin and AdipoQ Receptor family [Aphelenchoides besseyi]|nr:Progestin and AdipoQ Receptor family [Aphelenchoides besseyi]
MKPRCLSCKTAAHCRRHNRILRLLHRDELPRSLWINEHIHTAYRPPNLTLWLCVRSALQWNNETLNIWSHLLGFVYFLFMQLNNLFVVLPNLNATKTDYLVCFLSVGGSQICMCLSVFYHTFGCIDQREHDKWLKADVFGISAGLIGMYLSGIYLSFYCFANELTTYLMALCFILLITIYVPIKSHLFQTKFYGTRIGYLHLIYGAIVSFGAYPAVHWIQLHDGFEHPHVVSLWWIGTDSDFKMADDASKWHVSKKDLAATGIGRKRWIGGIGVSGSAIRHSSFLHNPIAASIIGMIISMVLQNSTTFMSVLVSMVAGRSAVMNDVFNLLNYVVLLPTEMAFGLIERTSGFLVRPLSHTRTVKVRTLEALTSPLIQLVVQIQSSNVFRSSLIPLAGIGVISLDRIYPLFVGANIGTTSTATLAALSADPSQLQETMQMALCQTLYNLFGMLLFYPIPFMRQIPITIAMKLGNTTAKHRWFSICYTVFVFFLIPCFLIALSLMPDFIMYTVLGIIMIFIAAIIVINWFQISFPNYLPEWLKDWNFLPVWLHSLTFYDQYAQWIGQKFPCCPRRFFTSNESNDSISMSDVSRS